MERIQGVTVGYDHCARVWDGFTQEPLLTVFQQWGAISAVSSLPVGSELLTARNDGMGNVWSIAAGEVRLSLMDHLVLCRFS